MPITSEDEQYFGPMMKEICETRLSKDEDGWYARPISHRFHGLLKRPTQVPYPSKVLAIPSKAREPPRG